VFRWDVLVTAWRRVAANHGAPGVDRQSIDWIKHEYGVNRFLSELQTELADGSYRPLPVLRTYIPKEPGKVRPLGIPVVRDRRVLHLIRGWLTAGILDAGELSYGVRGTPQGGVLSPLLSNIYLHELDRQWDSADGELVRFADDFVILCKTEEQAGAALAKVRARIADLDLTVNEDKTRIGHVRDSFDFLGFTYREAYSERQKRLVRIKTPRVKSQKKIRAHLKQRLQKVPLGRPLSEAIVCANSTLRGWANYFKIGNSYEAGLSLTSYACSQVRLWLRRKKHRKDSRCTRKWPNGFFYSQGLCYVPDLLRS